MGKLWSVTSEWLHQAHHFHICIDKKNDILREIFKKSIQMGLIKVLNMVSQNIFEDNLDG